MILPMGASASGLQSALGSGSRLSSSQLQETLLASACGKTRRHGASARLHFALAGRYKTGPQTCLHTSLGTTRQQRVTMQLQRQPLASRRSTVQRRTAVAPVALFKKKANVVVEEPPAKAEPPKRKR